MPLVNGFLYIGVNQNSDTNACRSAQSLRAVMPKANIAFFTDQPDSHPIFDITTHIPSRIGDNQAMLCLPPYPDQGYMTQGKYMLKSPWDRTIYVDYDVHFLAPVWELFDLLDNYDMAAVHDPGLMRIDNTYPVVPPCVCKYNTGVIAYNNNANVKRFDIAFWDIFKQHVIDGKGTSCENSFTYALHISDYIRMYTLSSEYNCRFNFIELVRDQVKILHGYGNPMPMEQIGMAINKDVRALRVFGNTQILGKYEANKGFS